MRVILAPIDSCICCHKGVMHISPKEVIDKPIYWVCEAIWPHREVNEGNHIPEWCPYPAYDHVTDKFQNGYSSHEDPR